MNETIQSKLAINIAQLSLEKAVLEARYDELKEQLNTAVSQLEVYQQRIEKLETEKMGLEEQSEETQSLNKEEVIG